MPVHNKCHKHNCYTSKEEDTAFSYEVIGYECHHIIWLLKQKYNKTEYYTHNIISIKAIQ